MRILTILQAILLTPAVIHRNMVKTTMNYNTNI